MSSSEKELAEQLKEIGSELLNPPSSIDALLKALDKAECLLTNVEQSPTRSMRDALLPLMKALISDKLMKHSEEEVKVTVISCITEITRITAPDAPYDDEKMKVIFQLTIESFRKLSRVSGRCYTKALSILDAVAKVRSCLVMLDLECDSLILEMVHSFLKVIRSNHPPAVFSAMEAIMTNVLDESEEISSDLLRPILVSVTKENQEAASISWKLGEKVISNCATKLQPYLMGAVQSIGTSLDDYAPIVISICRNGTVNIDTGNNLESEKSEEKVMNSNEPMLVKERHTPNESIEENPQTDAASESLISNGTVAARNDSIIKASSRTTPKQSKQSKKTETKKPDSLASMKAEDTLDSVPKKRGRKPNSLMNPDEGYDHYWIGKGREKSRLSNRKKFNVQETKISLVSPRVEKASVPIEVEKESSAHSAEKHMQSEDEVVNQRMKTMEDKAQVKSRKSRVVKSKDKAAKFSPVSHRVEKVSLPTEVEKEFSAHTEEKQIQSEDKVINENMKKTEEKAQASSRKSKVGKSRKDKSTKFSFVSPRVEKASLATEVEKQSSAHAAEKHIPSEDEVVNENIKNMEQKAQASSRKSKVVKSRKDKATKFSSVSPRVEKASLSTEVENESSAHAEEKHTQSEDEVVNENIKKMEQKAQASSRKSKVVKSRKDKVTKFSSVSPRVEKASLSTEVENESSAHAEEKHTQSEDEVVNENMKKVENNAQVRSRKSKIGKSKKKKTTKFASVSPRVETTLSTEVEKESSAHAEEKHRQSEDEVVNKTIKKMEEKAQVRSRKSKVVKSKKDKATLDPGCVVSEERVPVTSDYEEKRSVHLVMKLRVKSTYGDGSVVQKDVIVKSIDTNMDRNIHKLSTCEAKDSVSAKFDSDDYLEESPQDKATRKHAIVEKEVMDISSAGEELVGRRLKVWWPLDRKFYEGVVHSFDPVMKKHKISYDDGDEELLNLKKQRYELIGGDALLVVDEEMDVLKSEASSDIPGKRKRKIKSESDKEEKTSSSTRRGSASAKKKSKANSSEKAANSSMIKKHVISDESMDNAGSIDNSSKGNDKRLIDLIKNSRLKISLKSKQNAGKE